MHAITLFIQEIRAAIAEKKYWCYHDLSFMTVCTFGWKKTLTIFFVCISFFCSCLYLPLQETPGFTLHLFTSSAFSLCSFSHSPTSLLICCRSSLLSRSVSFCLLLSAAKKFLSFRTVIAVIGKNHISRGDTFAP